MMESSSSLTNRPRASSQDNKTILQHDDYTVAWISALPLELTAAEAMLDTTHEPLPQLPQDTNCYTLGSINGHNVVMACLPKGQYGTNNAATVATHLIRSFPNIQHGLMVGIGGGAPGSIDVRLGDVVVSTKVLQYDLGKALPTHFQRIACSISPSSSLLTAVSKLQASQSGDTNHFPTIIQNSAEKRPNQQDRLFQSDYNHPESSKSCDDCDQTKLVPRHARQNLDPVIHFGQIASGNQVIKDAHIRDSLAKELDCICFEMESAGMMNSSHCLAIRGICDYSDSHKNKEWQGYAALTAAAYAKNLLLVMSPQLPTPSKRKSSQGAEVLDTEARNCLEALFVTDPTQDREDILDAKGQICEGTCEWILSTEEFKTWEQNSPHLLWISAPPGVGKTFLSIYLSKHFEALSVERYEMAVICFFCDNKIDTRNTAVNILRGLIYQMIAVERDLVQVILPAWGQGGSQIFEGKSFGILWKVFQDMIEKSMFCSIYCVVDALDECEHGSLSVLLAKFEQLSSSNDIGPKKIKLVCLSRRFPERIPECLDLFTKLELDMMPAGKEDVERFIAERVSVLARKKKMNEKMKASIERLFRSKSEGTFLWVSFMAQDLENKNLLQIEKSLGSLPEGLNGIYDRILSEIDDHIEQETVHKMLEWILVATRPLRIPELCEAAGVTPTELLSREEVCLELIKSCGHLLQITKRESLFTGLVGTWAHMMYLWLKALEEEDSHRKRFWSLSVTFLHQSARDYFSTANNNPRREEDDNSLGRVHGSVASHLIRYYDDIRHHHHFSSLEFYELTMELPLTLYATRSWPLHFEQARDIEQVALEHKRFFSKMSQSRRAYGELLESIDQDFQLINPSYGTAIPLLHLACFLGLPSLVAWCLQDKQQIDINLHWGEDNCTPLQRAILQKDETIINILIDADTNILASVFREPNAFIHAIQSCSIDILRRMSRQNECRKWIMKESENPQTRLLLVATEEGNEEACRFLVEELEWDVNFPKGNEPIYTAIAQCHFKLARIFFFEWHAHLDNWKALETTITPWGGFFFVPSFKKMLRLLTQDLSIDINAKHENGYNACVIALQSWHDPTDKLQTLIEFGCNPNQPDDEGRTPLHYSAMTGMFFYGSEVFNQILGLLLSQKDAQVDRVCRKGWTVLHHFTNTFKDSMNQNLAKSCEAPQSLIHLLDKGVDRQIQDLNGLSALQILETCLFQDHHHLHESTWMDYVEMAKEMIMVLQDYCTVPDQPRVMVYEENESHLCSSLAVPLTGEGKQQSG